MNTSTAVRRSISIILLIIFSGLSLYARSFKEDEIREGTVFPVPVTEDINLYSFIPSDSGSFSIMIENFEEVPMYFLILDELYEEIASNIGSDSLEPGLSFEAVRGRTYHIAAGILRGSDLGKTASLLLSLKECHEVASVAGNEVHYFYGSGTTK